jgi:hypothetical protein
LTYRLATPADVVEFYGRTPAETLRVAVVLLDGKVVGIVGLARSAFSVRLFSEYKPELTPHLSSVTVWRAVKVALRLAAECPCPVYVESSDAAMMERIGFYEVRDGLWRN